VAGSECAGARGARLAIQMKLHHYRDMFVRAINETDGATLDKLVTALIQAETAKQILRAKGYGECGMPIDATARLVPGVNEY
jgi:hypothetical protein